MLGDLWREYAKSTEHLQKRKRRLEKSRDYLLQALDEAETKSSEKLDARIGPLVRLVNVFLDLSRYEQIVTEDPDEAADRKRKAFQYAEDAILLSCRLPVGSE